MNKPIVFLSYAREDSEKVQEVYNLLQKAGFAPWLDTEHIFGGEDWEQKIRGAIRESDFFLMFLSHSSVAKRGFLQRELRLALRQWEEKLQDDIFLIPLRLDQCEGPEALSRFQWIDYFKASGWPRLHSALLQGVKKLGAEPPMFLRQNPVVQLTEADAIDAIKRLDLFENIRNSKGKGIQTQYVLDGEIVTDQITGLMWQSAGTPQLLPYVGPISAMSYIRILNLESWGGYSDWRLPTLEEAMSLMKANRTGALHIPVGFSRIQEGIYTSDTYNYDFGLGEFVWIVLFRSGECQLLPADERGMCWVRAVRSTRA